MTLLEDGAQTQLSGTLSTSDVDKGDTATFTPGTFKGTYGTFTIDANGNWTYTLDKGANATQALAQGQIATESFAVVATDQSGASVSKVISMNLVGTNDVPTVNGIATGTTVENLQLNAVGFLQATDVDTGDKITQWRVLNPNGTYGSLSIDQNGKWIYTLDNNDADTKALKAGQTGQEAFQVVAVDLSGGTSQPFSINVDVIGTQNRAPGGGGTPPSGVTTTHPTIVANVIENTKPKDSGSFSGAPGTALKDPEFKAPDENSSPTRVGNNADNHIKGTNKQGFIDGRGGNDRIDGGDKDDRIHGGDGNDQLKGGKGDDVLRGGSGNDLLDGGSANKGDTAEFTGSRSEYRIVDLGNGQGTICTAYNRMRRDRLIASNG
ncbi:hypothetical protein A3738_22420 [Oleiphilus sp. HI0066]|nr:hypothetical protein A3738_22420 [Oleiphilus sp. HI0066]